MYEYRFRNLPCRDPRTGKSYHWCVIGEYSDGSGGGILEWCYSQKDANDIASDMGKDSRFTNLRVGFE